MIDLENNPPDLKSKLNMHSTMIQLRARHTELDWCRNDKIEKFRNIGKAALMIVQKVVAVMI